MKQQWHSGFDDSSGWGRLIDPVCLFILCQIAGTLWVITPRKAFAPPVAPNASVDIHRAEAAGLMDQKSALEKAVKLAHQELATLSSPVQSTVTGQDRMAAQIRTEEQQVKELEAKLDELTRKESDLHGRVAEFPPPSPQLGTEAAQLDQQLASRQSEVKRLQGLLEQTRGPGGGTGVGSPRVVETNLELRPIHLIGNRAVPIDQEHYKFERGRRKSDNEEVVVITKTAAGETIDEIQRPNSDLMAFLKGTDPTKQFLFCLVTSDSLPIFREVRRIAQQMKIRVAWDTNYDSDGVIVRSLRPSPGGRKAKIPEGR
jgi:hypothetical protein